MNNNADQSQIKKEQQKDGRKMQLELLQLNPWYPHKHTHIHKDISVEPYSVCVVIRASVISIRFASSLLLSVRSKWIFLIAQM